MKNILSRYRHIFLFIVIVVANSCSSDNTEPNTERTLVTSEFVYAATAQQIKLLAQLSGLSINASEFQYDVDIYKVTYHTNYDGSTIDASGLIALPKTAQEVGMLSFEHGTLTKHSDAPSNFSTSNPNTLLYAAMASSGFIGVVPDYLGFGSSSSILHPYYVESLMASSIIDMLKSAADLAEEKNIKFNGKLFLAGYSEGGYAAMATHKALEENGLDGFTLVASFVGAGAYDLTGLRKDILNHEHYGDPHYLAYIARAYQIEYSHDNLLTDFFKEPYATRIPSLFDGQKGADEINDQLTTNISDLIQDDLKNNIDIDLKYKYLNDAFAENSLTDWAPKIKLFMYHGLADATVPYQNSVDTYNQFIANGASTGTVSFTSLNGTHSTAIQPYITDFIPKLLALR